MTGNRFVEYYRIFFSVLIFIAIFFQLYFLRDSPTYNLINYVSYFTVLSNFFVASVLMFSGLRSNVSGRGIDMARGASTLYILITGLSFIFLLGGDNDQLLPWVNIVLHYVAPIIMLSDWFIEPIKEKIKFGLASSWMVPPFVYLGYCLIRGQFINWYPYEFLDPRITSWEQMTIYCGGILVVSTIIILLQINLVRVKK